MEAHRTAMQGEPIIIFKRYSVSVGDAGGFLAARATRGKGRAPKEKTDFWKCSKWDLSYLINHWCTTRKLIGFELGAAP